MVTVARARRLSKAIRVNAGAKDLAALALAGRLSPMHISRLAVGAWEYRG